MEHKLAENYSLGIELHPPKARLIVFNNGVEWICRLESLKNLNQFFQSPQGRLFKGRLQLAKYQQDIGIEVKGKQLGIINVAYFEQCLNQ